MTTLRPATVAPLERPPERPLRLALFGDSGAERTVPVEPLPESALRTTLPYGDLAGSPPVVDLSTPLLHWDRYEFLRLLGCGGMGEVYQARDRRLQRVVALKFIRLGTPELNVRLAQEARAQARIDHPYVCKVYEVGELAGQAYIVMQYIDGTPLDAMSATLSLMDKLFIMQKVAIAIHEAHKLGIIHRDIKPGNIMVKRDEDGSLYPVIMDFGLARESSDEAGITEQGAVLGTPAYMAPEQARGDLGALDRRSDVYSIGATLYELVGGRPPFQADSIVGLLLQVIHQEPPRLAQVLPSVPPDLETIVMKCLHKEPNHRYDSAKALADDLGRYLHGEPIAGRPMGPVSRLVRRAKQYRGWVVASGVSLTLFTGAGIDILLQRSVVQSERARTANQARLERELAQKLKDMEWLIRSARQLPLHDLGREKSIIKKQMAQLQNEMQNERDLGGQALSHYALGRGYMALQDYPQALTHLQQAMQYGYQRADIHYALGFVLGKHYEQALYEARISGSGDLARRRLIEYEAKYLKPAIASLERSRAMKVDTPSYLEGLIAFYQRDYDLALREADAALLQAPWLYEASQLAGDVHLERALQARDGGRYPEAEKEFAEAVRSYEEAARVGQSDARVYEGLAEAWVRQIEMAALRGQSAEAAYEQALLASAKISAAESKNVAGPLKKAFAALLTVGVMGTGRSTAERVKACLASAQAAQANRPEDPYARYTAAACRLLAAEQAQKEGLDAEPLLREAVALLEGVLRSHQSFLWALNDLASAYCLLGQEQSQRGAPSARASLESSLTYFGQASSLDPNFINAIANSLNVYAELLPLVAKEPTPAGLRLTPHPSVSVLPVQKENNQIQELLASAQKMFEKCLKLNPRFSLCYINYATVNARALEALERTNQEIGLQLIRSQEHLMRTRDLASSSAEVEKAAALTHLVAARDLVRRGQDPVPQLAELHKAIERWKANGGQDAAGWLLATQKEWLAANWQEQAGKQTLPTLKRALLAATKATAARPETTEAYYALAETHLRLAQAKAGRRSRQVAEIDAGLVAAQRAISVAGKAGHPKAMAVQSSLSLMRTQLPASAPHSSASARDNDARNSAVAAAPLSDETTTISAMP